MFIPEGLVILWAMVTGGLVVVAANSYLQFFNGD